MIRAFLYGLLVLLAVDSIWLVCIFLEILTVSSVLASYVGPFLAAAVTAYRAPRRKDLLGMLIAVPAAATIVAVPMIYGAMGGTVDSLDATGLFFVSYLYLFISLILCGIGSSIGSFLAKRRLSRTAWNESNW